MIRSMFGVIIALALCCGTVLAGEDEGAGLKGWLRTMQKKLDLINPRKTMPVTTGVAGVRGAKQDDKAKLYWKGVKEDPVSEAELKEFADAIAAADQDDRETAARRLEAFMQQHPDSPLIPDAKKTLDLVKAEPKKEEAAAKDAAESAAPKETPAVAGGAGSPPAGGQAEPAAAEPAAPTGGK